MDETLEIMEPQLPTLPALKTRKPRKPMTEKQLENARKNMEKGRQKRAENIALRKKLGLKTYTIQEPDQTNQDSDSDMEYEELVAIKDEPIQPKSDANDDVKRLQSEMAALKSMLAQTRKPRQKASGSTVVNVQMPTPVQPQPESTDAQTQKRKMLLAFGRQ